MVSERWIHETPFKELAAEARVARASLLHAFPQWRDVVYSLLEEELGRLDVSCAAAQALKRARSDERVYEMLAVLLERAKKTGRLYPNLERNVYLAWPAVRGGSSGRPYGSLVSTGGEAIVAEVAEDHYASVEFLLQVPRNEFDPSPIGECLVNLALDLAAGYPSYWADFDERRQTLRRNIELIAAGLGRTGRHRKRTKRKR